MDRLFELDEAVLRGLSRHRLSSKYPMDKTALSLLTMTMMSRAESGLAAYRSEHPIVLFEGHILDGRHRQLAAIAVLDAGHKVRATAVQFDGSEEDAESYAFEANLARRQMTQKERLARLEGVRLYGTDLDVEKVAELHGVTKAHIRKQIKQLGSITPGVRERVLSGEKTLTAAVKDAKVEEGMSFRVTLGKQRNARVETAMEFAGIPNAPVRFAEFMFDLGCEYLARWNEELAAGRIKAGDNLEEARRVVLSKMDWEKHDKRFNLA